PSVTASTELRISVLSTPRGKGGLFHRLWTQADPARWSRHRITIDDAIEGGCPIDRESLRTAAVDETVWQACYLCEFIDEMYSLLSYDLIQARVDQQLPYFANLSKLGACGDLYAGFDVGRKHDLSVLALLEPTQPAYVCRGFVELSQ